MGALIQSLIAYQEWADKTLLSAVRGHAGAVVDETLRKTLHHIVMVERFYLLQVQEQEFDREMEGRLPDSLDALEERMAEAHTGLVDFASRLSEAALAQPFHLAHFMDLPMTLQDAVMQMILHGQNHRGQCLMRLRELGADSLMLDYLIWVKHTSTGGARS